MKGGCQCVGRLANCLEQRLEWKHKSECGKRNRFSEPAGLGIGLSKNIGGSRSYVEHAIQLGADLKGKGTNSDLFKKTHEKNDGTFVDARSHSINEMTVRFDEASQPTTDDRLLQTPTIEAMDHMYLEVVDGVKKKRLHGIGSQAHMFPSQMLCQVILVGLHAQAHLPIVNAIAHADVHAAAVSARCEELTKDNMKLCTRRSMFCNKIFYHSLVKANFN